MTAPIDVDVSRLGSVARRLGMTEGQVYTSVVAIVVSLGTALIGIPPVLDGDASPIGFPPQVAAAPDTSPTESTPAKLDQPAMPAISGGGPATGTGSGSLDLAPGGPLGPSGSQVPEPASSNPSDENSTPDMDDGGELGRVFAFATIAGPRRPNDVAVGSAGDVWTVTSDGSGEGQLLHFDAAGTLLDQVDIPGSGERGPRGVTIAPSLGIIVVHGDTGEVFRYQATTGDLRRIATIPDVAPCLAVITSGPCQPGLVDERPAPMDVLATSSGTLYVSDSGQSIIWRIPDGGAPEILTSDEQLQGVADEGTAGMDLDTDGSLLVAVTASAAGGTGGAVYRIPLDGGEAGSPELVTTTDPGSRPRGIGARSDGSIFVTLAGTGEVVVLEADGTERTRLPNDPLADPQGTALRGGSLLVATGGPGGGAIMRLPVREA